eukprot:c34872_g1_i1 orf=617-1099(+)
MKTSSRQSICPIRVPELHYEPQAPSESGSSSSFCTPLQPIGLRSLDYQSRSGPYIQSCAAVTSFCSSHVECSSLVTELAHSSDENCWTEEECVTPRAKGCRIPEVNFCPPAPRKPRATTRFRMVPHSRYFIPDFDAFLPLDKIPARIKPQSNHSESLLTV